VAVCDMALHGRVDASNGATVDSEWQSAAGGGRRLESGVSVGEEFIRRSRGCHSVWVRDV
jgi:hypothetical protein